MGDDDDMCIAKGDVVVGSVMAPVVPVRSPHRRSVVVAASVISAIVASLSFAACTDSRKQDAACEQLVVATCATREHCGGVDAKTCETDHIDRDCDETLDDTRTCVTALNAVLTETCALLPGDLPCAADLLSSALYDACVSDAECRDDEFEVACYDGLCSQPCDDVDAACPREGACNTTAHRCEHSCSDDVQPCASGRACVDDRCITCEDACDKTQCGTGTTCDCGRCVATACETSSDCPDRFGCLEGGCAACRVDDQGECISCVVDGDCGDGICDDGGICV